MRAMQPPSPRLRQIGCVLHAALIGLGAAATGGADALRGHDAVRYGAVLGTGVLAVLHVLDPKWPVTRRSTTAWASGSLLLVSIGAALSMKAGLDRLGVVILGAWCFACTLNAAALVSLVGSRASNGEAQVVSFRVAAALFVGVLGWAAGVRIGKVQALLPAALAIVAITSLVIGASRLEGYVRARAERASQIAAGLMVSGVWLAVAAVAVASFTLSAIEVRSQLAQERAIDWLFAAGRTRLGWLHAFPLVAASLVVFLGRFGLAGLGIKRLGGPWFSVVLGCAVFVAGTRAGLPVALGVDARAQSQNQAVSHVVERSEPSAPAVQPPVPSPSGPAPATSATVTAADVGVADVTAEDGGTLDGSVAPEASAPEGATGSGMVIIESLTATGIMEKDARGGLLRRMDLLDECVAKSGLTAPGTLSARLSIDANGSVPTLRITGGDLVGTPFAVCAMRAFYRTGFASGNASASIELTLRATPPR
jgi:hypothetical protein